MPRSVNIANLQNAFAQLGQSNARIANMEMAEREKERQRRAQMLSMIGGVAGGAVGGPAGAQAGAMIGASLAGSPSSYQAGASLGTAMANQQRQGERESALMAFQGIPEQGTQPPVQPQQKALQPLQETEEIEQAPQSPLSSLQQPFVAGPDQPSYSPTTQEPIIPQQAPQEEEQGLLGTLMNLFGGQGEAPQVQPTQQVQQAQQSQLQPTIQGQPIIPISQPSVQQPILRQQQIQRQGIQFDQTKPLERTFGRIAQQANQNYENQLNILRDPRLLSSPELLMMQQKRVEQARVQAQQAQTNLAKHQFLQQEASQKRIQKEQLSKQPLYNIRVGDEVVSTGLSRDEARNQVKNIPPELRPEIEVVGKRGQEVRGRFDADGSAFKNVREAKTIQELEEALIGKDAINLSSYAQLRLVREADKVRNRISEKNAIPVKKKIDNINRKNFSYEENEKIRKEINDLEDRGEISADVAMKLKIYFDKKESRIEARKKSRTLKQDTIEDFHKTFAIKKSMEVIFENENFFKNMVFERAGDKFIANFKQGFGVDVNKLQEINSALSELKLSLGHSLMKGVLSDQDLKEVENVVVNLGTAPQSARNILSRHYNKIRSNTISQYENLQETKDFGENLTKEYNYFIDESFLKRSPNTLNIQGTSPNSGLTLAKPESQSPIQITAENINSLKAGDTVLNRRGKPVVLTQEALNRLLGK